jgi:hypothetical protein
VLPLVIVLVIVLVLLLLLDLDGDDDEEDEYEVDCGVDDEARVASRAAPAPFPCNPTYTRYSQLETASVAVDWYKKSRLGEEEGKVEGGRERGAGGDGRERRGAGWGRERVLRTRIAAPARQRACPRMRWRSIGGTPSAMRSSGTWTRGGRTPPEKPPGLPGGLFGLRSRGSFLDEEVRKKFLAMRK